MRTTLLMLIAALTLLAGCNETPPAEVQPVALKRYEAAQPHMGTFVRIVLYAADDHQADEALNAAFARVTALNQMLSDYVEGSEVNRLSASAGGEAPVKVSDELWTVLTEAALVSDKSGGAFDITVGPVVQLWRRARRDQQMPDAERLRQAREAVGYEHIEFLWEQQAVRLTQPGMQLDLGGIAKGFVGDEVLITLKEHGVTRALVDAGGDIVVGEAPPDKPGWKIAVRPVAAHPTEDPAAPPLPAPKIWLVNAAIATSGDAFQHVVIDGQRYSHLVDPTTGLGTTESVGVSVIAPTGIVADAYASALSVLPPEKGLPLIESVEGAHALIVRRNEDGAMNPYKSKSFDDLPLVTD